MKNWVITISDNERMELERIVIDGDAASALDFLDRVIRHRINESTKKGGCYQDASKPVSEIPRPISRHRKLGSS